MATYRIFNPGAAPVDVDDPTGATVTTVAAGSWGSINSGDLPAGMLLPEDLYIVVAGGRCRKVPTLDTLIVNPLPVSM